MHYVITVTKDNVILKNGQVRSAIFRNARKKALEYALNLCKWFNDGGHDTAELVIE